MKNLKRRLVAGLSLVLTLALLFTACGPKQPVDSNQTTPPASTEPAKTEEPPKVHHLKLLGKGLSATHPYAKWEDREKLPSWKLFQEQLKERNLELEFEIIAAEQFDTVIQTRLAGGSSLPDIVNLSVTSIDDTTAYNYGKNGTIIDINSAIEQYSDGTINKRYEDHLGFSKRLTTAPDGKRYWFATATSTQLATDSGEVLASLEVICHTIRKDWLDQVGLPMPTTVDEWVNALRTFRDKDVNGNKQKDEVITFDLYSYSFFTGIAQWFGLVPDIAAYDPTSGKVTSPWYQEGVKDYFQLMNDLAKEGIFDVNLVGATEEAMSQKIAQNKIAGLRSYAIGAGWESLIKDVDADYAILPPLQAKEGVTPYLLCDTPDLSNGRYAITKDCKDVEGAIKLFDYIFSEDYKNVSGVGVKDVDYKVNANGDVDYIDTTITAKQRYESGNGGMGVFVSGPFLPRITWPRHKPDTMGEFLAKQGVEKTKMQLQRRFDMMDYRPYVVSPFSTRAFAIASQEETETFNKYYNALKTYSEELSMNLILGNESLNDWDKHIKKLQELGLDEIIKLNQARYDRYNNAK